jgi:hypothetical protein
MRRREFLRLLIIACLVAALLQGPISLLRVINPSRVWILLPLVGFIVALEAALTTRWFVGSAPRINRAAYRAAELLILLIAARLISWVWSGDLPGVADIRPYLVQPASVIDFTFVIYAALIFFAWERSISFTGIFADLAITPAEKQYFSSNPADRSDIRTGTIVLRNRGRLMQGYLRQWIIGGLVLAFFATITTFRLSELPAQGALNLPNLTRLGLRPELLAALLVYFLGGLWLASQARVDVLEARWLIDGSEVDKGIARSWQRASPLLLIVAAAIAAFLPIGSTFAISQIIQVLANFVLVIVGAIVAFVSLVLFLFASLLSGDAQEQPLPPLDLEASIPQIETSAATSDTAALITGSLFWVLFICVAVAAIIFFLRGRGIRIELRQIAGIWEQLTLWLKELWTEVSGKVQAASTTLANRLNVARANVADSSWTWPLIRIGKLSPREQIRFFYLATVRRGGRVGMERAGSDTPLEYASRLKSNLPESEEDIERLTNAFLKARYSEENVGKIEVDSAKDSWKRLTAALRRTSKGTT